ncbi:hypothetical protein KR222_005076, partial [Zaprionus bogoriensis]
IEMGSHLCYDMLKQLALEGAKPDDLEALKKLFSSEISSARKSDRISTINELIDCLERNDVISEDNVKPLGLLGKPNAKLQQSLDDYQSVELFKPSVNAYREQRLAEELQQQLHISAVTAPTSTSQPQQQPQPQHYVVAAQFTEQKRSAIYTRIAKELGRSWRNLGRQLDIAEGTMDEIEQRFPNDLKSRILRLLQIFEEDECNDPRKLLLQLCQGLADCGRKDLRRKVEQIMSY